MCILTDIGKVQHETCEKSRGLLWWYLDSRKNECHGKLSVRLFAAHRLQPTHKHLPF